MRDADTVLAGAQYAIAIITAETSAFPDMQHFLAPKFNAALAQTEKQIQSVVEDPEIRAVLMDLDSIGEGPTDGLRLLQEIRQVRDEPVAGYRKNLQRQCCVIGGACGNGVRGQI